MLKYFSRWGSTYSGCQSVDTLICIRSTYWFFSWINKDFKSTARPADRSQSKCQSKSKSKPNEGVSKKTVGGACPPQFFSTLPHLALTLTLTETLTETIRSF